MQILTRTKESILRWLERGLPTCKEITKMASDSIERKLPLRQRIVLKLHFLTCVWCARYFKQLQFMREAMQKRSSQLEDGESSSPSALTPEAHERIKRSLKRLE